MVDIPSFRPRTLVSSPEVHKSSSEVSLAFQEEVNTMQKKKRFNAGGLMEADQADTAPTWADYYGNYDYDCCSWLHVFSHS